MGEIGRISEAIKVLERVIKIKPDYAKAIKQLAKGYEISQDFEKAIEYYLIAQRLFSVRNNIKEKIQINNKLNTLLKKYGKTSYLLGIIFFPNV